MSDGPEHPFPGRSVARHALAWLVLANAVGVLLAILLLHPSLGGLLGPLGYGRWMPVHMNGQLYGWCALPLAGLLLRLYWVDGYGAGGRAAAARWALRGWSLALALGCAGWLGGVTSGKLFMDWHGWTRPLLPLAMLGLWVLVAGWEELRGGRGGDPRRVLRVGMLGGLFCVPWVFYWACDRSVFPTVNPDSGGATGTALLGSTLGIVLIHGLAPHALGLARRGAAQVRPGAGGVTEGAAGGAATGLRRLASWNFGYWGWALLSLLAFALADHGDASHHAAGQLLGLGLLLAWAPLSWGYLRSFAWPEGAGRWLLGGLCWWALLLSSGWLSFLPGISERLKFTHGLVSHAHLALACYITAMNWVLLAGQGVRPPGRSGFLLWQAGCVLHVGPLFALGWLERDHERELFLGAPWVQGLLSLRLLSGLLMLGLSLAWLISASRGLKSGASGVSLRVATPVPTDRPDTA